MVDDSGRRSLVKADGFVLLHISNITLEDAGEYSCQANTTLTNDTVEALSFVTVAPTPAETDTKSEAEIPFTSTVWFLVLIAEAGIVLVLVVALVTGIAIYCSRSRRGKYSINGNVGVNAREPTTKDVLRAYENWKQSKMGKFVFKDLYIVVERSEATEGSDTPN